MLKKPLLITFLTNLVLIFGCATVDKQQRTIQNADIRPHAAITIQQNYPESFLRVATLNLAHGRKDSFNQLLVSGENFKEHLNAVADVLSRHKPHIVALQEADAESRWSGGFDHVAFLASAAGYPWRVHASNAENWLFSFGTALLSVLQLNETLTHTFEPSPPTLDKGFVLTQIDWPYDAGKKVRKLDILSVHFDFSRQSVRGQQIKEMMGILSARMNPTIIMGDFNSEWLAEASVIQELATKSRFSAYKAESHDYNTYKDKRLDWILVTKDLEFIDYKVLPDTISDHSMVIADIRFKAADDEALFP